MRIRPSALVAALLIVLAVPTVAAQSTATSRVGSDSLHRLIAGYLSEPFKNGTLLRDLLDSAKSSPHVVIRLSYGVVPWMCELSVARQRASRTATAIASALPTGCCTLGMLAYADVCRCAQRGY